MVERLTLAQQHLYALRACPRRFYLRFVAQLPWPEEPLEPGLEEAYERGRRFHRWIERALLGLSVPDEAGSDPVIAGWWATFRRSAPAIPDGLRFVETTVTVPVGRHFLTGRFDLLVITTPGDGDRSAALFDWKTGEPRDIPRLERAWQTRVYLAVLTEGGAALVSEQAPAFKAERQTMTYWYVEDPEHPRVLRYSEEAHARNWSELLAIVAEIDSRLASDDWPLTDDWTECRRCAYRAYCDRLAAGDEPVVDDDLESEDELDASEDWLEPLWT